MENNKGELITIVTLNPSIDRMYFLDKLNLGEVQRAKSVSITAGGKGLNVAKVCNLLGHSPRCIGFLGGYNGKFIEGELKKENIQSNFTYIKDETRICLNLIDKSGISTEILEKGPTIDEESIEVFKRTLLESLNNTKILVVSGSIPKGIDSNFYKEIGQICESKSITYILDASGDFLELALSSHPFLIKPNKDELEYLTNIKIETKKDAINAANKLISKGANNIAVSLGKDGMLFINKEIVLDVDIPKIKAINPVGSGDASIAGFAYGLLNDYSIEDTIKLANACGMSNATKVKTGDIDISQVKEFFKMINIKTIV
ncbi:MULTISPECIES: 1-phosphofructokinase [unclassified Romboutsia]|uniref:1-phosphofructokinase n=1 Tax=unclassified Romboutsia TaxID=2626894 RepID=UPI0008228E58|nr:MULTISPECIES: 1-phosphofructokinase [unclassified Romboutsia]SCI22821.1 Tagatose-6-phosphate kinase [uncultured Clostridium sp.]